MNGKYVTQVLLNDVPYYEEVGELSDLGISPTNYPNYVLYNLDVSKDCSADPTAEARCI